MMPVMTYEMRRFLCLEQGEHVDCWSVVFGHKTIRCRYCGVPIWQERKQ